MGIFLPCFEGTPECFRELWGKQALNNAQGTSLCLVSFLVCSCSLKNWGRGWKNWKTRKKRRVKRWLMRMPSARSEQWRNKLNIYRRNLPWLSRWEVSDELFFGWITCEGAAFRLRPGREGIYICIVQRCEFGFCLPKGKKTEQAKEPPTK